MFERPDALAALLALIDQEADPYQSTRVARALRRVVVRDLDRRVAAALMRADQDMHNATPGADGRGSEVPADRLVVLADSLAVLRPDGRSSCLAGCARIVAKRFAAASSLLGEELARGHRGPLQGWLSLNLGAAEERRHRLHEAHAAYGACGEDQAHPSSTPAALFALFVSLRVGKVTQAERDLHLLVDRDSGALHEALRGLRIHYCARYERSASDPLALVRPSLLRLGSAAAYVERELHLAPLGVDSDTPSSGGATSDAQQASMEHDAPSTGAGGVPTRISTAADRRQPPRMPPG